MLIANIRSGHYFIIENDRVIAEIFRKYRPAPKGCPEKYWSDGYRLIWKKDDHQEYFRTLKQIGQKYHLSNYPGYNSILS